MDQPPPPAKVLYDDTHLRLVEQSKIYTLEYLAGSEVEFHEVYDCKLCALRALLLATIQLQGHCDCSPSVLRLEDPDVIESFAGGRN